MTTANEATDDGGARLTLHAIDTCLGQTRAGLRIDLSVLDGEEYRAIRTVRTLERGRTAEPMLHGDEMRAGRYELLLYLGEYFAEHAPGLPDPPFLSRVPIRFGVADPTRNLHVPILFSPWSWSFYRGN